MRIAAVASAECRRRKKKASIWSWRRLRVQAFTFRQQQQELNSWAPAARSYRHSYSAGAGRDCWNLIMRWRRPLPLNGKETSPFPKFNFISIFVVRFGHRDFWSWSSLRNATGSPQSRRGCHYHFFFFSFFFFIFLMLQHFASAVKASARPVIAFLVTLWKLLTDFFSLLCSFEFLFGFQLLHVNYRNEWVKN